MSNVRPIPPPNIPTMQARPSPIPINRSPPPNIPTMQDRLPPAPQPMYRPPNRRPIEKKQKNWIVRIIVVVVIVLVAIGLILVLYYFVFTPSEETTVSTSSTTQTPSPVPSPVTATSTVPFPNYVGSGGVCTYDTDCPVITRREIDPGLDSESVITYTQYCVDGTCATNKICSANSDCLSSNTPDQNADCDPINGVPCRYTSGCVNGYCQRLRCQNNVNCGLFEACTVNQLDGDRYGYCLPLGNTCNNTQMFGTVSTGNGSIECWGGFFPCTGQTNTGKPGYCTQCYAGSDAGGTCNMTDNINTGPGSVCEYVIGFDTDPELSSVPPATCRVVDNINYTSCVSGYVEVTSSTASICCNASTGGMCGKVCQDDYQCDDNCPFCVNGVCSCVQVSPFSLWRSNVSSNIPCSEGYGMSGTSDNMENDVDRNNEILDDVHVCVVSNALVGTQAYNYYTTDGVTGNLNCSGNTPYYNIAQGKCTNTLDGAACYYDIGSGGGYCRNSDGTLSTEYVCGITGTCRKGKLQAGEKCGVVREQGCDTGLICSSNGSDDYNTTRYKTICIPEQ